MTNAIEVKNLNKKFDYYRKQEGLRGSLIGLFKREKLFHDAVKNLNFSVAEGELIGFIGPNGAGKTTTLKILAGILHPTDGEVRVLGFKPWERRAGFQKQISLVMGNKQQLWWDLPAMESFLLNQKIYDIPEEQFRRNVETVSHMLGIKDILDVQVRKLSLGQRMKAELALALLHDPKVLFLDEPTIGLDVISQKNIREFLKNYNQKMKTTIILTSHYMDDIKALAKRVVTIDHGQIIYDGALDDLIKEYASEKILKISFSQNVDKAVLEKYGRIQLFESSYAELIVPRQNAIHSTEQLLASLPVDDLLVEEVEIEEVVRQIFQKGRKMV